MNANHYLALILTVLLVTACGGEESNNVESMTLNNGESNNVAPTILNNSVISTTSAGRLLASQCAQCHGTDGISISDIDSLAGEGEEILEEMTEMKRSTRNDVMHLQAKGYSDIQIREIANYFSSLSSAGKSDDD